MPRSMALVPTANGSRYLQQLCKHWGHKFTVSFDPHQGRIDFGPDEALALVARVDGLELTVSVPEAEPLAPMEQVVADHLLRFAFREDLQVV